jgi:hypothetical protein
VSAAPAASARQQAAPVSVGPAKSVVRAAAATPAQRAAASKAAFLKTTSVRIRINGASGGSVTADLRVGRNVCQGTVTNRGSGTMTLRRIGRTVYLQGDAAFWRAAGITDYASVRGKWARYSFSDPDLADVFRLCSLSWQANNVFTSGQRYAIVKGKTVDGKATVGLTLVGLGGTVYIAAKGTPYPLLLTNKVDSIRYQQWGAKLTVAAPPSKDLLN